MRVDVALLALSLVLVALVPAPTAAEGEGGGRTAVDPYVAGLVRTCNVLGYGDALLGPAVEDAVDGAYETATGAPAEAFDAPVGACFPLRGDESVAVVAAADSTASSVHVWYVFVLLGDRNEVRGAFCDAAELPVPRSAYRLEVYVHPVGECGTLDETGTTGSITATFL